MNIYKDRATYDIIKEDKNNNLLIKKIYSYPFEGFNP